MGQPMPQCAIFRHIVMDQHREQSRLTDQMLLAPLAVVVQPCSAMLIRIELSQGAFVERFAHQTGGVLEAEPGLVVELNGAELPVVADEDSRFEALGHCLIPISGTGDGFSDFRGCSACIVTLLWVKMPRTVVKHGGWQLCEG